MMKLAFHLQIVGVLQWLLASLHPLLARRFAWKEELSRLSLINREIFIVHCIFIVLILLLFGALNLLCADLLLAGNRLSVVVLGGLTMFWGVRLYAQWCIYSHDIWRGRHFETTMHWFFTLMWLYHVAVYGAAFWSALKKL